MLNYPQTYMHINFNNETASKILIYDFYIFKGSSVFENFSWKDGNSKNINNEMVNC